MTQGLQSVKQTRGGGGQLQALTVFIQLGPTCGAGRQTGEVSVRAVATWGRDAEARSPLCRNVASPPPIPGLPWSSLARDILRDILLVRNTDVAR